MQPPDNQPPTIPSPSQPPREVIYVRTSNPFTQIALGCLTILFTVFLCAFLNVVSPEFRQGFMRGLQPSIDAWNNVHAAEQATPTLDVTSVVGHSHPLIGSTIGDFIVEFGPPEKTTSGSDMFVSGVVQITAYVNGSVVYQISATGPKEWTANDAQKFCAYFLPNDAQEFSHTPALIDYHSGIGQITMQLQPPTCVLFGGLS